jgi:diguanylate cyclase (GGDEF)-like protein
MRAGVQETQPPATRCSLIADLLEQGRKDVAGSHYRRAYGLFMQASLRAHEQSLQADEAHAQALLAFAAAVLGHSEEGIETAMLATQLVQAFPDDLQLQALVGNYLGVALMWNGSHEGAEAVLANTYEQAKHLSSGLFWQPMINRGFNEAYRLISLRHLERQTPDPRRLQTMLDALDAHAGTRSKASTPSSPVLVGLLSWLRALAAGWASQTQAAYSLECELVAQCESQPELPVLQVMADWLHAELALIDGQREQALLSARKMLSLTERIEHVPLHRIALLLQADLHEISGRSEAALDCLRQLQKREHQLRQVSMHHRRNVATLRFELRQHKLEVQHLKSSTQQLQRLSMEDALTGLANRRGLELLLAEAIAGAPPDAPPLYVAVVDVDQFKAVNDRHSHQLGDQVLRALAELFRQQLRGEDLAGRWGGDEFVLAFRAADEAQAQGVVERLRRAVQLHPWGLLATGLCVTISLGLAEAQPGDSLDDLLLRSDLGMYAYRRQRPSACRPVDADDRPYA